MYLCKFLWLQLSIFVDKNAIFKPGIICYQVSEARKSPLARSHPEIHIKTLSLPPKFSSFPFGSGKMPFTSKFHLQSPSLAFMREAKDQNDIAAATFPDIFNSQTVYQANMLLGVLFFTPLYQAFVRFCCESLDSCN